jgi:hypothetical protein
MNSNAAICHLPPPLNLALQFGIALQPDRWQRPSFHAYLIEAMLGLWLSLQSLDSGCFLYPRLTTETGIESLGTPFASFRRCGLLTELSKVKRQG